MSTLTHIDAEGRASMVDVAGKTATDRIARAEGRILLLPETLDLIRAGAMKKGDCIFILF